MSKEINISIQQENVFEEVARTTSYTGAKMVGDDVGKAYDRIFTVDEDRKMLLRFWNEACNIANDRLRYLIVSTTGATSESAYTVELSVSSAFDDSLTDSISSSLFSWFVNSIVAKWYIFTNKDEADTYGQAAGAALNDAVKKLYFKKKPTRKKISSSIGDKVVDADDTIEIK